MIFQQGVVAFCAVSTEGMHPCGGIHDSYTRVQARCTSHRRTRPLVAQTVGRGDPTPPQIYIYNLCFGLPADEQCSPLRFTGKVAEIAGCRGRHPLQCVPLGMRYFADTACRVPTEPLRHFVTPPLKSREARGVNPAGYRFFIPEGSPAICLH